jgi:hypothetical protein
MAWLHQLSKIAARLPSARASHKITEVHGLFLFMAFHKVILEWLTSVHTARQAFRLVSQGTTTGRTFRRS